MKHVVERLDKEDIDTETVRYAYTKKMLLEYIEAVSILVWCAKRRMELGLSFGWIGALLILDSAKKEEVWILKLGGRFQITVMDCL